MSLLLALTATVAPPARRVGGGGSRKRFKRYEPPEEEYSPPEIVEVPQPYEADLITQAQARAFAEKFEAAYWNALNRRPVVDESIRAMLTPKTKAQQDQEEMDIVFLASLDL